MSDNGEDDLTHSNYDQDDSAHDEESDSGGNILWKLPCDWSTRLRAHVLTYTCAHVLTYTHVFRMRRGWAWLSTGARHNDVPLRAAPRPASPGVLPGFFRPEGEEIRNEASWKSPGSWFIDLHGCMLDYLHACMHACCIHATCSCSHTLTRTHAPTHTHISKHVDWGVNSFLYFDYTNPNTATFLLTVAHAIRSRRRISVTQRIYTAPSCCTAR